MCCRRSLIASFYPISAGFVSGKLFLRYLCTLYTSVVFTRHYTHVYIFSIHFQATRGKLGLHVWQETWTRGEQRASRSGLSPRLARSCLVHVCVPRFCCQNEEVNVWDCSRDQKFLSDSKPVSKHEMETFEEKKNKKKKWCQSFWTSFYT